MSPGRRVPRPYRALRQRSERVLFFLRRDIWLLEVEALPAVRAC